MARRARGLVAGSIRHVVNRGALRSPLFADEIGARLFLGALRDALGHRPVDLLGWCLMPNHWHLLVRPTLPDALPPFMRWLTLAHSRRWQVLHGRPGQGTLYQGRYRSAAIEADAQLLTVLRYIERNPVRARLVANAADWPWSSLHERLDGEPGRLTPLPIPLPAGWLDWVNAPQTAMEAEALHRDFCGAKVGRPLRSTIGGSPNGRSAYPVGSAAYNIW
jgi:putative transposase